MCVEDPVRQKMVKHLPKVTSKVHIYGVFAISSYK